MWMIRNKNGDFILRANSLLETDEMVAIVASREREKPHLTSIAPTKVLYEDSSYALHLTGNFYALFDKGGKQLHVGTLEECDMELCGITGDCARTTMEYPFGYSAVWVEKQEFPQAPVVVLD